MPRVRAFPEMRYVGMYVIPPTPALGGSWQHRSPETRRDDVGSSRLGSGGNAPAHPLGTLPVRDTGRHERTPLSTTHI